MNDLLSQARSALFAPVDIRFLVFFRVFFGAMMLWTVWDFVSSGQIASVYIDPPFHFTFHGFSWVQPWPGSGMYVHFAGLAVLAAAVMAGALYRVSAALLFLGFTYVFLLEKAVYLNHYYLMCLLCFLLIFLPAHRFWSIDALLRPALPTEQVPAWTLWLLRFQIGIPYVYGGIAKLNLDWLQGQPMQMWLAVSPWRIVLGPVAEEHWFALVFSWGGLFFDLCIVPLLLWQRTRAITFGVCVVFHLMNAFMFDIGVFPWLMIGATTVFLSPDWPRDLVETARQPLTPQRASFPESRLTLALLSLYVAVQLIVPFRHCLYPGNVHWTEEGYMFAWYMMLTRKVSAVRMVIIDRETRTESPVDLDRWLTRMQRERLGQDPELIREFAHFLRQKHAEQGQDVEVHGLILCSLNGRKAQHMIDPRVDLSRQPRTIGHQRYIVPLIEPFRQQPWDVPIIEWSNEVLPLPFVVPEP